MTDLTKPHKFEYDGTKNKIRYCVCWLTEDSPIHVFMQMSTKTETSMQKSKLIISHGTTHPFGEKCKICDKIKKEYMTMIKKALPSHKGGVLTRSEVKKILDTIK